MKKILLIIFLNIGLFFNLFAQTTSENLQKYWYYRERLKNFVLVSSNYNEPGTNIPAFRINKDKDLISWDDGNGALNQYISMLATEYKLLKIYGQDYSQTTKELYYALKSFERLDVTAEYYYRTNHTQYSSDLNGFFIREDITKEFWNKYGKDGTNPYFKQKNVVRKLDVDSIYNYDYENSEDNCWHLLESFSLVNALVENEMVNGVLIDFKQIVKDNVNRIISSMIHHNPINTIAWEITPPSQIKYDLEYLWYILNPVTNELVNLGNGTDGTMLYASYGFAQVGNKIVESDKFTPPYYSNPIFKNMLCAPLPELYLSLDVYHRVIPIILTAYVDVELSLRGSNYKEGVFDFVTDPPIYKTLKTWSLNLADIGIDDYELRSLCATGNIKDANGLNPYKVLIKKQNENTIYKYEHLPLIWSIVNNSYSYISSDDRTFIFELLNEAPACGPYFFESGDDGGLWSCGSRLIWPENQNGGDKPGEYNGLDYMLLHNLYWLSTISQYPQNINYNPLTYQSNSIVAINQITCSESIDLNDNSIEFFAGNSIKLLPGFKVEGSSNENFIAKIDDGVVAKFKKLPLTGYNSCNDFIDILDTKGYKSTNKINYKTSEDIDLNKNDEKIFISDIKIYPNPIDENLNIESNNNICIKRVEIYNNTNLILTKEYKSIDRITINISEFETGIYFVKIFDENNKIYIKKIIKI